MSVLLILATLFYVLHAAICCWDTVIREHASEPVDFDFEDKGLVIQTSSYIGSGDYIDVDFYGKPVDATKYWYISDEYWFGGVGIKLSTSPMWTLKRCMYSSRWFPISTSEWPTDTSTIWRITKTNTAGDIRLQIHCNDKEVLNVVLSDWIIGESDSLCNYDGWRSIWSGRVTQIRFTLDDASKFYKAWEDNSGDNEKSKTWEACNKGEYLDQTNGCLNCPKNQWSNGGCVASCTNCPADKGVAEGAGTSEDSCSWNPCEAGQHVDYFWGCINCPENSWSGPGNTETSCTACPTGKVVAVGQGKQESDCSWNPCEAGQYYDKTWGCRNCPENHFSEARNIETSCTACPNGKVVAVGQGKQESDCSWKACSKGQFLDQTYGCLNCNRFQWSDGGFVASCTNCPTNRRVSKGLGTSPDSCDSWEELSAKCMTTGENGTVASAECPANTPFCKGPSYSILAGVGAATYGCGRCGEEAGCAECVKDNCNVLIEAGIDFNCIKYIWSTNKWVPADEMTTCKGKKGDINLCNAPRDVTDANYTIQNNGCGWCLRDQKKAGKCVQTPFGQLAGAAGLTAFLLPLLSALYTLV